MYIKKFVSYVKNKYFAIIPLDEFWNNCIYLIDLEEVEKNV